MKVDLTINVTDATPTELSGLLELIQTYVDAGSVSTLEEEVTLEAWREAESSGWDREHVRALRDSLRASGHSVQLAAFDRAIENGGSVSRAEVYALGRYEEGRKLNNWLAPFKSIDAALKADHFLPPDAKPAITPNYGPGTSFRPVRSFDVAPEIVRLMRES